MLCTPLILLAAPHTGYVTTANHSPWEEQCTQRPQDGSEPSHGCVVPIFLVDGKEADSREGRNGLPVYGIPVII
jgi:hypothetical protein